MWFLGHANERCEAFSTYPRTYDLLHASTIFSDIKGKGCSVADLLIEMDRILRPKGFIIVRDRQPMVELIKKYLVALNWEAVTTADSYQEIDRYDDEIVFIIQKKMWVTSESFSDSE